MKKLLILFAIIGLFILIGILEIDGERGKKHKEQVEVQTEAPKFRYKKGDMVYSRLDSTKYIITNTDMVVSDYWAIYVDKNGGRHEAGVSDAELY